MTILYKLAIVATAAIATLVSAAPIDPTAKTVKAKAPTSTTVRHTTAAIILEADQGKEKDLKITAQGSSDVFSGRGTWFTDSVGSCGVPFDTGDMIVAMNAHQMGGTAQCGKSVKITSGGKTVTARITDTCPAQFCSSGSLDLSQAVFKQLAPLSKGVISIEWEFV